MSPSSPAGSSSSSSLSYTNVLLALPDGPTSPSDQDATSHCTSIIGGYPTFPPFPSSLSASPSGQAPKEVKCGVCHQPIPLLAQVYCPPEGGENDRTVYVFGCARIKCQKRDGCIRAFRASIRNEEYVRDVEAKKAAAEKEAAEERERARKNPFTISSDTNGSALFGSAQPLFGGADPSNPFSAPPPASADAEAPDLSSLSIASSPTTSTTLAPPQPAYQPSQYLTTIEEYIPPVDDVEIDSDSDDDDDDDQQLGEVDEAWEKMLPKGVDEVFESFVRRLEGADGGAKQVLRYELGGIPLPYSASSPLCRKLFPGSEKPLKKEEELDLDSLYDSSTVPTCGRCGSKRTFELQLVPSLISVLRPNTLSITGEVSETKLEPSNKSEEERKKELMKLASALKANDETVMEEQGEMEWGTVMVFGCEKDCVGFGEEWVGVEWESA